MCDICGWIRCPVGCPGYDPYGAGRKRSSGFFLPGLRFTDVTLRGQNEKKDDSES